MGVMASRVFEYFIACDVCSDFEVYHTYDTDHEIIVHSLKTAIRASQFHSYKGIWMCPRCYEDKKNNALIVQQRREKRKESRDA